ncbi:hypothetical protein GGI35DRAFT_302420 [Trichoderma velutinum]
MPYFFFSQLPAYRKDPDKFFNEWIKEVEDYEKKCALHQAIYMGKYSHIENDRVIVYRVAYTKNEHVVWSFSCKAECVDYKQVEIFEMARPARHTLEHELDRKWREIWDNVSTNELKKDFARVCEAEDVPRGVLRLLQPTTKLTNGAELTVIRIVHD